MLLALWTFYQIFLSWSLIRLVRGARIFAELRTLRPQLGCRNPFSSPATARSPARPSTRKSLHTISFAIPVAWICGLLGPNGAGKATLFRLTMSTLKATHGLLIDQLDPFEDRIAVKRLRRALLARYVEETRPAARLQEVAQC